MSAPHTSDVSPPADETLDDGALLAWIDGRLGPAARARVDALLRRDPAARDLLFDLARGPSPGFAAATVAAVGILADDPLDYALAGPFGGVRAAMDAPVEADADEPPLYAADGVVDLILRPGAPLAEAPEAAVFVAAADGPLRRADAPLATAPGGAMRLRAPAARLFDGPGRYALCVGLGAGEPERFVGLTLGAARAADPDVRWLAVDVFFDPAA